MAKKKKKTVKICNQCLYLSKDGDDWICGCGRGLVQPFFPICKEFESI